MIEIRIKKQLRGSEGSLDLDIELREEEGIFMSMFGPSGSGKTSVLRMICGLMRPDEGFIKFGEEVWFDSTRNIDLKPQLRNVGIVFQDYGLFPNMTARGNLKFAQDKGGRPEEVSEMLLTMKLEGLADQPITKLSGGQQQRVALARTLIQRPSLLLLDEPLSATDTSMRKGLQEVLAKVHKGWNLTTLLVSHEKEEILRMADRVYQLEGGRVLKSGSPLEVLYEGASVGEEYRTRVWEINYEGVDRYAMVKLNQEVFKILVGDDVRKGDLISINLKANFYGS